MASRPLIIRYTPRELFWYSTLVCTILFELLTVFARVYVGKSAAQWNAETRPPLLVQMHHMFWSVPFIPLAIWLRERKNTVVLLWGFSLGLILSDLLHHFLVLPLWVGNTGWHWP